MHLRATDFVRSNGPMGLAMLVLAVSVGIGFGVPRMIADFLQPATWEVVEARIARDWPSVPQISTEELARQLALPEPQRPLLIDVRTAKEFEVSHIPDAIRAGTSSQIKNVLARVPADRPVVFSCAIGMRSADAASKVIARGRGKVSNLAGSLFKWANEGRPLESHGRPVLTVMPYGSRWLPLLDQRFRPAS